MYKTSESESWGRHDNIEGDAKKIPGDGWAVSLSFSLTLLNILCQVVYVDTTGKDLPTRTN